MMFKLFIGVLALATVTKAGLVSLSHQTSDCSGTPTAAVALPSVCTDTVNDDDGSTISTRLGCSGSQPAVTFYQNGGCSGASATISGDPSCDADGREWSITSCSVTNLCTAVSPTDTSAVVSGTIFSVAGCSGTATVIANSLGSCVPADSGSNYEKTTCSGTTATITAYTDSACTTAAAMPNSYSVTADGTCQTATDLSGSTFYAKLTCGCDASAANVGGCFSGASTVVTKHAGKVPIADVNVGDYVLSVRPDGTQFFDKVFRITHHAPDAFQNSVRITTEDGQTVELTENHYLHVGSCCSPSELTLAVDVKEGDVVFVADEDTAPTSLRTQSVTGVKVVKTEMVGSMGAFNLHTLSSSIVVNGIAASHFTTAGDATFPGWTRDWAPYWYSVLDKAPIAAEDAKAGGQQ